VLRAAVDEHVIAPARLLVEEGIARAVARGELDASCLGDDTLVDLLFDVLAGALMHRLLVREREVDDAFAESITKAVMVALGARAAAGA
jgi:hypothetical protein